jgi:hypothetical protein
MWPTLQQPWYFMFPTDIAVDEYGNVYVADTYNHRIRKLTADGFFIKAWGNRAMGKVNLTILITLPWMQHTPFTSPTIITTVFRNLTQMVDS